MHTIRVGVFDPHETARIGLMLWIRRTAGMDLTFSLGDYTALLECLRNIYSDVLVMEWRASCVSGEKTRILNMLPIAKECDIPFVVYTAYNTCAARNAAIKAGAAGFLDKAEGEHRLIETIRQAVHPPTISLEKQRQIRSHSRIDPTDDMPLTRREIDVLQHVVRGLSNKEMASAMGISSETVKEHMRNILRKLELHDRTEAGVWAVRKGLA